MQLNVPDLVDGQGVGVTIKSGDVNGVACPVRFVGKRHEELGGRCPRHGTEHSLVTHPDPATVSGGLARFLEAVEGHHVTVCEACLDPEPMAVRHFLEKHWQDLKWPLNRSALNFYAEVPEVADD